MKILPVEAVREADLYTIRHEDIAGIDLMERAANACFQWISVESDRRMPVKIFCGTGNNGGDGFAIARMLAGSGSNATCFLIGSPENCSPDCAINYQKVMELSTSGALPPVTCLTPEMSFPLIEKTELVIDAVFGSGLSRPVTGFYAKLIRHINRSGALVIAIDVPSGFSCDTTNFTDNDPVVVRADHTLTFSPPKLGLFFPENDIFVGKWILLDIGISETFIAGYEVSNFMAEHNEIQLLLRKRNKFDHKGRFGHALLLCGSEGKMGAAVLAAGGCLRSGAGLVTLHLPGCGVPIVQTAVPEVMVSADPAFGTITTLPDLTPYTAIGTGPGLGKAPQTANVLKLLIQQATLPIVFDADAINLLSENKTWLGFLPPGSVFTPHPKEFERIAGKTSNDFDRNKLQKEFSFRYQCWVVLKGAHTAITSPDGRCWFNSTGNPGMATGGCGDVLTGIITGLLAQGYPTREAVLLGVYVHGLAGDLALSSNGYEALIASDLINNLGKSFQSLYGKF